MKKIGIFGSAFDPPTLGHVDAINQVDEQFDCIVLVLSANHAFGKKMTPWDHRLNMLNLMYDYLSDKVVCQLAVSEIEQQLLLNLPDQPVYTYDVMSELQRLYSDDELCFLRGPDNANPEVWSRFYRYQDIEKRWSVVDLCEQKKIRSSMVRDVIQASSGWNEQLENKLKKFLTKTIREYIANDSLYFR